MTGVDDGLFAGNEHPPRPPAHLRPAAARQDAMGLSDYVAAAGRYWWIVLFMVVLGVIGALAVGSIGGKSYESATMIAVAPSEGLPLTATMIEIKPEKVATAAELVSGEQLMDRAAAKAGIDKSVADLYRATGTASLRGSTVDVVVTGPSVEVASKLSDSLVSIVSEEYAKLYTGFTLRVVDGPTTATSASGPSRSIEVAVGAIIGLGVGMLIAVALESGRRAKA